MFKAVSNKVNFAQKEDDALNLWDQEKVFEKSIEQRPKDQTFFFYDGPPFATGLPHYGHILAGTIKDVVPRYQTMKGKRVERRFGWDCHGLPVEFEVEKELGLKGKTDIEAMGIPEFNEKCRSIVLRYTSEWEKTVTRMGRWVDFKNDYKTMDIDFMESIWWVFKRLWDKGLIYESGKIVPYSARLGTPLSNFEVNLGYRDVQDPSITIKFKSKEEENTYFLAWTTTPWTLPSNLALTVSPQVTYVKVESEGSFYYLAKELILATFEKGTEYKIISECLGTELEGKTYEPLLPYFAHYAEEGAYQVCLGDYVTTSAGTGIVHTAPMFGEDDFQTGKKYNLPNLLPMNDKGEFNDEVSDYAGVFFKDADKAIIRRLKEEGKMFKHTTIEHSYPFCWRSDTPLMYRSIRSWFVNVEKIKETMIENNQKINWQPAHIKDGRMGKWLEGARDWAISRNRYWGNPIPVWICDKCGNQHCVGSREELETLTDTKVDDLHRHFIDDLTYECSECDDGKMERTTEVLDCWFESGSMPYGQKHYPFENKEELEGSFPANFISEGIDQTRGWFYTLSVLSAALFEKPAFQNCVVSGMILAEDGKKMSKSKKNYPDPMEMINKYGADAIRLYMLNSGAIRAEELKFSEIGLQETLRNTMIPLWNSLSFFTTYASIDEWSSVDVSPLSELKNPLDRWILSRLHHLILDVTSAMDEYSLQKAVQPFVGFIDTLTNWYIRRSRRRFWKGEAGEDKNHAYTTLYTILFELSKVIAPFVPFLAENCYQALRQNDHPISVHLCDFPVAESKFIDKELEEEMDIILSAVNMGRAIRAKKQIKIRQPLSTITLVTKNAAVQGVLGEMGELIKDELNIKAVEITENEEELVSLSAKPNLKILGPKYGKKLGILRPQILGFTSSQVSSIQAGGSIDIDLDGETLSVGMNEILIQREQKEGVLVETEGDLTVALDISITKELQAEGYARDFINKIQLTRKEREFAVTDRINVRVAAPEVLKESFTEYANYIKEETLADGLSFSTEKEHFVDWDINGVSCSIEVTKAS